MPHVTWSADTRGPNPSRSASTTYRPPSNIRRRNAVSRPSPSRPSPSRPSPSRPSPSRPPPSRPSPRPSHQNAPPDYLMNMNGPRTSHSPYSIRREAAPYFGRDETPESLGMTGESWRLVDSDGTVFYVDEPVGPDRENFLGQVIASGAGWSPNYRQKNLEEYATLEGNYDPTYASRPLDISLSGRALHVRGGPHANIVSYSDTDSISGEFSRSSSVTYASSTRGISPTAWSSSDETLLTPEGPTQHGCGCEGRANGLCGRGQDCCMFRPRDCCDWISDNVSLLEY